MCKASSVIVTEVLPRSRYYYMIEMESRKETHAETEIESVSM